MWKLIISFVLLLFDLHITICTDNSNNITLAIFNDKENGKNCFTCNGSKTYTLLEGEAAEVIVNHNHFINVAWCRYSKNPQVNYTGDFIGRTKTQTRLSIIKTQATPWNCTFLMLRDIELNSTIIYDNTKYTPVYCWFNVHLRLLNGPSISINRVPVETKRLDVLTSEYDYVGSYHFQPDLPAYIKCFRPQENAGSLQLILTSASTGYIFVNTSHEYMNREIFVKLTEEHDNSYLDCLYETIYNVLRVRVHMHVLKSQITEKDSLIIKVNGERLNLYPNLNTQNNIPVNYLFYDMTYSNDTYLNITCETHAGLYGEIKLTFNNIDGDLENSEYEIDGEVYKYIPSDRINNRSEITCSLKTNQDTSKDYVIKFMRKWLRNGLLLSGLSSKNILFDYEKSNGLVHEIHYQYKDNDTLNLNCYCETLNCLIGWTVKDQTKPINSNIVILHLDDSYDNVVIKCLDRSQENTVSKAIHLTLVYQNQPVTVSSTTTWPTINAQNTYNQGGKINEIWFIIGGISACLIIVLLGVFIYCLRKNKDRKLQTEPQGIQYETLQTHNQASSHFDICNTYSHPLDEANVSQYSVPYKPTLNDLYAKPIPKSKRPGKEGTSELYAEIDNKNKPNNDNRNDVTYAELSLAKPADIYAEVLPKNQRNAPESNYAEFYAEAIPISQCHYGNISDNQRYVNSDGRDDYAVPAYCELLVKRNMK